MRAAHALVGQVIALGLAACSAEPSTTVEDGAIRQYVSTIVVRRDPLVQVVVLDDRDPATLERIVSPSSDRLERDLVSIATGFDLDDVDRLGEDHPREVAVVLLFPASGRVAAAPEVPALHVRSPAFSAADAKRIVVAMREQLAAAVAAPRADRYEPIEMARDVRAPLTGARAARTAQEARIAADTAGLRLRTSTVLSAPFEDMSTPIHAKDSVELRLLGECPRGMAGCKELHDGDSLLELEFGNHSYVPIPGWAVLADGRASCVVEVSGKGLGCESRGWTRLRAADSGGHERCAVPQLEPTTESRCTVDAGGPCGAGFYVGTGTGPHLRFTKRAYPHQTDAEIRVVCTR